MNAYNQASAASEIGRLEAEQEDVRLYLTNYRARLAEGRTTDDEDLEAGNMQMRLSAIAVELDNITSEPLVKADRAVLALFKPAEEKFVTLPEAIRQTVVGKLAKRVAHCLEFPESSAFLALLGSASASVATSYAVQYASGTSIPAGLFVVIEQPPATQKSRLLNIGMRPYEKGIIDHNRRVASFNNEAAKEDQLPYAFWNATDATSAALDEALSNCDSGRFVIASAEQSAFASLFPSDTYAGNNELLLKGYPGEYVSSLRKGRKAFHGVASGSVVLVAQPGSAKRVFSASNGSGLAERFLYMAEPSLLGSRTHHGEYLTSADTEAFWKACAECVADYSARALNQAGSDRAAPDPETLHQLKASADGYKLIRDQAKQMEARLGLLAKRGDMVMLSWLGKLEQHVLKVAAVLHVIECRAAGCTVPEVVPASLIRAAIDFVLVMGDHLEQVLHDNGESGDAAEVEAVITLISDDKHLGVRPAALKLQRRAPFRAMGKNAYMAARKRIEQMIQDGFLMFDDKGNLMAV